MPNVVLRKAVISGIGPDHPGIVAALTKVLFKHQANIEDSTMTRLAKEFAVILIIALPENTPLESVEKDLYSMEEGLEMTFTVKPLHQPELDHPELEQSEADAYDRHSVTAKPYMISVSGQDRTGITYHVSQKLADMNINITDLNAQVIDGEEGPVYIMMLEVMIPDRISLADVEKQLKAIEQELGLDVGIHELDTVAL